MINITILFLNRPEAHCKKVKYVGQISVLGNIFDNSAITQALKVYIKSNVCVVLYSFVRRLSYSF